MTDIDDLTFAVLRNAAYHNARQAFFIGWHRLMMFVTALSGTAVVNAALTTNSALGVKVGFVTAVFATLDLVLGLSERASAHARLRERAYDLLAEVQEAGQTPKALRKCTAALTRLYGQEPPTMCAVDALAHNAAKASTTKDIDPNDMLIVPWYWHYPLRHILPFSGTVFLSRRERDAHKLAKK